MSNYWSSSPYPHELAWPQTAYHQTKDAKQVNSPAELEALGPEWSTKYADKKRDYPKTKFRAKAEPKEGEAPYETTVVADPEAEGKLEGGWGDTIPGQTPANAKPALKK
jgi:hypothetical protein